MLFHVTLFCPLAWRVSHWRTVLSLTSRATFLPIWLALTFHSPWLMCLFFLFFPFLSFPAAVYFYLWSDIEARKCTAEMPCSWPFPSPALCYAVVLSHVTFFLTVFLHSFRTWFPRRGVILPSWNPSCWSLGEIPPQFLAWCLWPEDNISDPALFVGQDSTA